MRGGADLPLGRVTVQFAHNHGSQSENRYSSDAGEANPPDQHAWMRQCLPAGRHLSRSHRWLSLRTAQSPRLCTACTKKISTSTTASMISGKKRW